MVSFQRMKDELDDLGTHVTNKIPPIGRNGCFVLLFIVVALLFLIGFGIGYSTSGGSSPSPQGLSALVSSSNDDKNNLASPYYVFISNTSYSCPPLTGERLLTTMEKGQSFEGLVVNLACRGDYNAFPNQIKCRRKSIYAGPEALEWSHVPVCYPSVLVSKAAWTKTLHSRSVSCTGDSIKTSCSLTCIREYIAVESQPYECLESPCPAWSLGDARCFMCDQKCKEMHTVANPRPNVLLDVLGCSPKCSNVLVNSNGPASIWQNKRTGLFKFMGEHNGRPVFQNNATQEFLFFTFTGSEWLIGPDFRKPHAGVQIYGNKDTSCPERIGGKNISRLYIDSSEPSVGGSGTWKSDETLEFKCMEDDFKPVQCDCKTYKVYTLHYLNGTVPKALKFLSGTFKRVNEKEYGLLAPLYIDPVKNLYLFSHHPKGRMWQVSTKLSTTPLRGIFDTDDTCPDADSTTWEWFNTTTAAGQQVYVKDNHIQVKCLDGRFSGNR